MDDMDGEIELAQHATVRELVARLERERDEARAAREALWTEVSTGQTYARLQARIGALEAALRWALQMVDEGADGLSDENGTPAHRCEFFTNPEKGACDFHDSYWDARALLAPEATPPDDGRVP